jgi:hypothetical protein
MKLKGRITTFDPVSRKGIVQDTFGQDHIIAPGSFRRTTKRTQDDVVLFNSFYLAAGPTAQNIEPEFTNIFENFQTDLPR